MNDCGGGRCLMCAMRPRRWAAVIAVMATMLAGTLGSCTAYLAFRADYGEAAALGVGLWALGSAFAGVYALGCHIWQGGGDGRGGEPRQAGRRRTLAALIVIVPAAVVGVIASGTAFNFYFAAHGEAAAYGMGAWVLGSALVGACALGHAIEQGGAAKKDGAAHAD